jgi:hypothetical protein
MWQWVRVSNYFYLPFYCVIGVIPQNCLEAWGIALFLYLPERRQRHEYGIRYAYFVAAPSNSLPKLLEQYGEDGVQRLAHFSSK